MKLKNTLTLCAAALGTMILSGAGCPTIPEIKEKLVELALGGSMTLTYEARGIINDKQKTECFDLSEEIDLDDLIAGSGLDISEVSDIALSGVAYRCSKADPNPSRVIENSQVKLGFGGNAPNIPLVTNFGDAAGFVYDFKTASLDAAGVTAINDELDRLLAVAKGEIPNTGFEGCAFWDGISSPVDQETNFDWQIRLDVTILGKIKLDIPEY